ncbi:MAG: right-handed parallel beta-helix repeat-containing protein [Planctomycetota bacterium]|nr:right-handed parallel beta-helix repeat-containing protein [Planctomycetota bacterium]
MGRMSGAVAGLWVALGLSAWVSRALPAADEPVPKPAERLGAGLIPDERLADWRPGVTVGIPGGIPKREKLIDVTQAPYHADKTGAADASGPIMQAVAKAAPGEVVYLPAGMYRINGGIRLKSHITIRGDGPGKTVLLGYQPAGSIIGVALGDGGDWWYPQRLKLDLAGSHARGATELKVADAKGLSDYPNGGVGQVCQIAMKNDPKVPVVVPAQFDYQRKVMVRLAAKTDGTLTVSPALPYDLPAALAPTLRPGGRCAEWAGIEDLTVDGANSTTPHALIGIDVAYACWVRNVEALRAPNYNLSVSGSVQCEVRRCRIAKRKGAGSNGAGVLVGQVSFSLFEDNIVAEQFPHFEINGSTGNVFAYNYCHDSDINGIVGVSICTNHGAHSSYNLYEGNVSPKLQSDGYHGSASHDTVFRNRLHGTSPKTELFWICVNLNRFTRCYTLAGNVLGAKGHAWQYDNAENGYGYEQHLLYSFGMPNMGNGGFSGKVQPSQGRLWADWEKLHASAPGKGPGPGGFQELDLDVKATTLLKGNYNYKDNGVPESEALGGAALPPSLYRKEKPEWFGDLAWPAFGPDTEFEKNKIPAQVRFDALQAAEAPAPAPSTTPAGGEKR